MSSPSIQDLVQIALKEDLPHGDLTTDSLSCDRPGSARLIAKQDLVLSGREPFELTFKTIDPNCLLEWFFVDGEQVSKSQDICRITGPLGHLLKAERVALNFLGHLSGIATLTKKFVEEIRGTNTHILETRKTTPGLRDLEKKAVRDGGGQNHRRNLSVGILIKENHIRASGGIKEAIAKIRQKHPGTEIEVEVTNLREVEEALESKSERILLDNMSLADMKKALGLIKKRAQVEASGNMTLDRVKSVAKLGVDFISIGSLTHSAPSADVSLLIEQ